MKRKIDEVENQDEKNNNNNSNKKSNSTQNSKSQQLFVAVSEGDIFTVQRLIKEGINLEAVIHTKSGLTPKDDGMLITPLCIAVMTNNIQMAELLIDEGADVNAVARTQRIYQSWFGHQENQYVYKNSSELTSALYVATEQNNVPMMEMLISKRANVNVDMVQLIHGLIKTKHKSISLEGKEEEYATVTGSNQPIKTILSLAASKKNVAAVKLLIDAGADVARKNIFGHTAYDEFIELKYKENAQYDDQLFNFSILETMLLSDKQSKEKLLLTAIENEDISGMKNLLNQGVDVNTEFSEYDYRNVKSYSDNMIKKVVETYKFNSLYFAAKNNKIKSVEFLLPKIVDSLGTKFSYNNLRKTIFASQNSEHKNVESIALLEAIENKNLNMISLLSEAKDVLLPRSIGPYDSLLEAAVISHNIEAVKLLISKGVSIDDGVSLPSAARKNCVEIVELLLNIAKENNIEIVDKTKDWTALEEACKKGHVEVVDLLIKYGANVDKSIGDYSPLILAATNDHLIIVQTLLAEGADAKYILDWEEEINPITKKTIEQAKLLDKLFYKSTEESNGYVWKRSENNLVSLGKDLQKSVNDYLKLCEQNNIKLAKADYNNHYAMLQMRFDSLLKKILSQDFSIQTGQNQDYINKDSESVNIFLKRLQANLKESGLFDIKIGKKDDTLGSLLISNSLLRNDKIFKDDFMHSSVLSLDFLAARHIAIDVTKKLLQMKKEQDTINDKIFDSITSELSLEGLDDVSYVIELLAKKHISNELANCLIKKVEKEESISEAIGDNVTENHHETIITNNVLDNVHNPEDAVHTSGDYHSI